MENLAEFLFKHQRGHLEFHGEYEYEDYRRDKIKGI